MSQSNEHDFYARYLNPAAGGGRRGDSSRWRTNGRTAAVVTTAAPAVGHTPYPNAT